MDNSSVQRNPTVNNLKNKLSFSLHLQTIKSQKQVFEFIFRIDDSPQSVFDFENFFLEVSRPFLKEVKVFVDDLFFSDSQVVTNSVNGDFHFGSDNLVAGKRIEQDYTIKIEGISKSGKVRKEIKIPARSVSEPQIDNDNENDNDNDNDNEIENEKKKEKYNEDGSSFSKQNKYLERLWAYLTLNKLQSNEETSESSNKIKLIVSKSLSSKGSFPIDSDETTTREKAERLALKYHFVTNVTSLIVNKKRLKNETIVESPFVKEDLTKEFVSDSVPSVVGKTFGSGQDFANLCSLELFSQTFLRKKERKISSDELNIEDFNRLVSSLRILGHFFKSNI